MYLVDFRFYLGELRFFNIKYVVLSLFFQNCLIYLCGTKKDMIDANPSTRATPVRQVKSLSQGILINCPSLFLCFWVKQINRYLQDFILKIRDIFYKCMQFCVYSRGPDLDKLCTCIFYEIKGLGAIRALYGPIFNEF
jgi:hypothetical protein